MCFSGSALKVNVTPQYSGSVALRAAKFARFAAHMICRTASILDLIVSISACGAVWCVGAFDDEGLAGKQLA